MKCSKKYTGKKQGRRFDQRVGIDGGASPVAPPIHTGVASARFTPEYGNKRVGLLHEECDAHIIVAPASRELLSGPVSPPPLLPRPDAFTLRTIVGTREKQSGEEAASRIVSLQCVIANFESLIWVFSLIITKNENLLRLNESNGNSYINCNFVKMWRKFFMGKTVNKWAPKLIHQETYDREGCIKAKLISPLGSCGGRSQNQPCVLN